MPEQEYLQLKDLAAAWIEEKGLEEACKKRRLLIEERMCALQDVSQKLKGEGSVTHKCPGFKVVTKETIYRRLDVDEWENVKSQIPENLHPVRYEPKLELKGIRYLEANEPAVYAQVARAIIVKPGKVGITVTEVQNGD